MSELINVVKVFTSRSEARNYATCWGLKVVDLGKDASPRWQVVSKQDKTKAAPSDFEKFIEDTANPVTINSQFFPSRGEARKFAKTVNKPVIIDHAKTSDGHDKHEGVVKDLGKQGRRWEVVYSVSDNVDVYCPGEVETETNTDSGLENTASDNTEENVSSIGDGPNPIMEVLKDPVVIMTLKNLQVTLPDGKSFVMSRSHPDFALCAKLFAEGDVEGLLVAIDVDKKPKEWSFGNDIKVIDGVMYHYGMAVESSLAKRIVSDCENDIDPQKYVNFFRKLMKNPSYKAVKMVYDFIQHNDLGIMDNGDIKAWKMIKGNGYDLHTGKVPNFKGMTVSMPRNMVEDNPNVTCSAGLHVAAKEYFKHCFGNSFLVEVSLSPEDVVSVPTDYSNSKCRSCRYTVLTGFDKPEGMESEIMVDGYGNKILNCQPALADLS